MQQEHAERMVDCLTVDEREAVPALEHGRLVFAVETPEGEWGRVLSVEPLKRQAFDVSFASGKHRVFQRGGTFWVERERKAWEA